MLLAALCATPLAAQTRPQVQAGAQARNRPDGERSVQRPLERLAGEEILVLPVQYLTFADSLGWSQSVPSTREYLNTVDDEITFALTQRGLKGRWTLAPDIIRAVARNQAFAPDPTSLAAEDIRSGQKAAEWQLHEPLASQLRTLIALTDARYVLFPVEMRFTSSKGVGHATLHLVIIDARRSQVQWSGDLAGAPETRFSPAIAADLASRLADLIAPRVN